MSFKENNYAVIKKAVEPKVAEFAYNYLLIKRQVARTLYDTKYISYYNNEWGVWNDSQVPNTYSHYGDIVMETLLLTCRQIIEKTTGFELLPAYAYARIYKKGDILKRHKDRFSCEISATMNLGGDDWPIYIEPDPSKGGDTDNGYKSEMTKGVEVNLKPGDMLVYRGNICEHWREPFVGQDCGQVFLHYNNAATKGSKDNIWV